MFVLVTISSCCTDVTHIVAFGLFESVSPICALLGSALDYVAC